MSPITFLVCHSEPVLKGEKLKFLFWLHSSDSFGNLPSRKNSFRWAMLCYAVFFQTTMTKHQDLTGEKKMAFGEREKKSCKKLNNSKFFKQLNNQRTTGLKRLNVQQCRKPTTVATLSKQPPCLLSLLMA